MSRLEPETIQFLPAMRNVGIMLIIGRLGVALIELIEGMRSK